MDLQSLLTLAGIGAGAFFIAKTAGKVDTRIEDRRRVAITLSTWSAANGLPGISQLLNDYAVADYSGVISQVRNLAALISNPDTAKAAVDNFLKVQLNKKLETVEGRQELIKFVEDRLNIKISTEAINKEPVQLGEAK